MLPENLKTEYTSRLSEIEHERLQFRYISRINVTILNDWNEENYRKSLMVTFVDMVCAVAKDKYKRYFIEERKAKEEEYRMQNMDTEQQEAAYAAKIANAA